MRVRTFQGLGGFSKSVPGRALTASLLVAIFPTLVEASTYTSVIDAERRREDEVRSIAKKLNVDPEFLLHPGQKKGDSKLVALVASLKSGFGLLAAPKPAPSAPTNIAASIQATKDHYALVTAD